MSDFAKAILFAECFNVCGLFSLQAGKTDQALCNDKDISGLNVMQYLLVQH